MIVICEPLCKGVSHEKVNSGFIYGLSIAFPDEKLRFYAEATHIEAIKRILIHDKISIRDIEYKAINFLQSSSLLSIVVYAFVFFKLFADVVRLKQNKIFFLSFSPETLFVIKSLKRIVKFAQLRFAIVLHAAFENVANDLPLMPAIALPRKEIPSPEKSGMLDKLRRTKIKDLPIKIIRHIKMRFPGLPSSKQVKNFLSVKKMMEWKHSEDFRYIALSPHILRSAIKYIDVKKYNIHTIVLPTNFVKITEAPSNEYVKFATFGYGDSLVLYNIAYALQQKKISRNYEIRIIGMDNRGAEGFVNVTCQSPGMVLKRDEMEAQAVDIDAFLILYDKTRYRLSCSGSILESISMVKPIVHFDNDCINEFNRAEMPIGIRCYSFDEYVNQLVDIIENYDDYRARLNEFRSNILKQRDKLAIDQSLPQLREAFFGK
jgi:hypothetical protein